MASDISYDCTCSDHLLLMTNERMVKAYSTVVVVLHPLRDAVPLCLNMQAAKCVAKSTRHSEGAHITPHCACPVSYCLNEVSYPPGFFTSSNRASSLFGSLLL